MWTTFEHALSTSQLNGIPANILSTPECANKVSEAANFNYAQGVPRTHFGKFIASWSAFLTSSISRLTTGNKSSDLLSYWIEVRHRLSDVVSCIQQYKQALGNLMAWLNSASQLLSTASSANGDVTPSMVLINAFVKSGNVLQVNLTRFLSGTMSKVELADAFSSWNNDLLNSASSLVSDIESSVIAKLIAAVDDQESTLTKLYKDLLLQLAAVQVYMAAGDTSIEQMARTLSIWQMPVIGLQNDQV
jgi:hypothetical protein